MKGNQGPWLTRDGFAVTVSTDLLADRPVIVLRGGNQYLAQLGAWVTIVQGVIFVVCVLTFRRGIVGELGHVLRKSL